MSIFTEEQLRMLSGPLDRSLVKSRKQGGTSVSYVEGWHVIAEANRIFGHGEWDRETVLLQETNRDLVTLKNDKGEYQQWRVGYLAKVRVTVGSVVREGTGFGSGMARPDALGEAIESAAKEAETDAMKRALMTFGNPFGLALYDKEQANVADPEQIAKAEALESLWAELNQIRTADGLKSFWMDNYDGLRKAGKQTLDKFTKLKDELKAKFEKTQDTVHQILDEFPGSRIIREEDVFPGDVPGNTGIRNQAGRELHAMEG